MAIDLDKKKSYRGSQKLCYSNPTKKTLNSFWQFIPDLPTWLNIQWTKSDLKSVVLLYILNHKQTNEGVVCVLGLDMNLQTNQYCGLMIASWRGEVLYEYPRGDLDGQCLHFPGLFWFLPCKPVTCTGSIMFTLLLLLLSQQCFNPAATEAESKVCSNFCTVC